MKKVPLSQSEFIQLFREALTSFKISSPQGELKDLSLNDYSDHLLKQLFGVDSDGSQLNQINELLRKQNLK